MNSQINDALIARQNDPKSPSKLMIPSQKKWPPSLEDDVRATLSPLLSPRPGNQSPNINADASRTSSTDMRRSVDLNRIGRRSMDVNKFGRDGVGRRSASGTRHRSRSRMRASSGSRIRSKSRTRFQVGEEAQRSEQQGSSDSYVQSMDDPTSSCVLPLSSEASASQILRDSDVFKTPTIQRSMSVHLSRQPSAQESLTKPPEPSSESASRVERPQPERANTINTLSSTNTGPAESSVSVNTFQNIVKAGSYPLQRAAGLAGYINKHSKRMSNLLATESMGYVEKVSGMWKGGKKHYDEPQELVPDDGMDEDEDDTSGDRFRDHFALPFNEKLQATYFGYLHRVLPLYGKIYISDRSFCFRSLLPGTRTKLILPLKDIENVDKEKGFRFGYSGLVVVIKGHEELFFEFGQAISRDDCAITLLQSLEATRFLKESGLLSMEEKEKAENASAEHRALLEARSEVYSEHDTKLPRSSDVQDGAPPIIFDDPRASILNFKPQESLTVTCLTIGSRGDVQPYIALCKGLLAEGHKPRIATHAEFKDWIERHGIEFAPVEGDPAELMRICVDNGTFTYSFFREVSTKFRGWLDGLMTSAWKACQGSDVVIEGPSAMAGIHIAEALRIPYFRAFSMPWTRTRAYPHAFAVPEHKMGGAYNYLTYVMFDNVFWKAMAGQVNRWRKKELGLQPTSLEKMQPNKIPFLYSFSPSVVIPPLDWSDWIRVTGYWFLDEGTNWNPPRELADFIQKARDDGKKLVYVGFGSIVVQDSAALMNTIIKSVLKADVRCILSKGWSDRLEKKGSTDIEMLSPPEIYQIKAAPHDWLFAQIDAAVHHGGSGTTGASLRAGLPTIIKPFFGDQFFFGNRVEDLGVGIILKKINLSVLSRALWEACHSERMIVKARVLGELIRKVRHIYIRITGDKADGRQENGVDTAIQSIYRDMEYAKSLIKTRDGKTADDALEESEESWTFIGDDNDPELVRRIHDFESGAQSPKTSTESDTGASKRIESGSVAS